MSLFISSVFTYDEDAGNYIQAVETADAQALEPATRKAINNFVIGCKQDGIWTAIKASCILAGARTLSGALVPLVGTAPTNFNFVSGDYNRKTGLVGDGSTKYLISNKNGATESPNNAHFSVFASSPASADDRVYIGFGFGGGSPSGVRIQSDRIAFGTGGTIMGQRPNGFIGLSKSTVSTFSARFLSSSIVYATTTTTLDNIPAYVYARNISNSPSLHANARLAFYSIGESLNLALLDARVTDLINAFAVTIP